MKLYRWTRASFCVLVDDGHQTFRRIENLFDVNRFDFGDVRLRSVHLFHRPVEVVSLYFYMAQRIRMSSIEIDPLEIFPVVAVIAVDFFFRLRVQLLVDKRLKTWSSSTLGSRVTTGPSLIVPARRTFPVNELDSCSIGVTICYAQLMDHFKVPAFSW